MIYGIPALCLHTLLLASTSWESHTVPAPHCTALSLLPLPSVHTNIAMGVGRASARDGNAPELSQIPLQALQDPCSIGLPPEGSRPHEHNVGITSKTILWGSVRLLHSFLTAVLISMLKSQMSWPNLAFEASDFPLSMRRIIPPCLFKASFPSGISELVGFAGGVVLLQLCSWGG